MLAGMLHTAIVYTAIVLDTSLLSSARYSAFAMLSGELKSPEVLAINPRGQVPTFKDGDIVVNESMALLQYVEETYPETPLLPSDKARRALAYQRWHETAALYGAIQPLFFAKMVGKVNTDAEKVHTCMLYRGEICAHCAFAVPVHAVKGFACERAYMRPPCNSWAID